MAMEKKTVKKRVRINSRTVEKREQSQKAEMVNKRERRDTEQGKRKTLGLC